jgi:CubicO group peptidase (beta-lactamase class C family)
MDIYARLLDVFKGKHCKLIRIGSISKTFVATAVMQLVEQGKLDLHTDINQYLTAFQEDSLKEQKCACLKSLS